MSIKIKQCCDCNSFCSNSASKCQVCGSSNIVKGGYTSKEESQRKLNEATIKNEQSEVIQCSVCCSPVPIKNGKGYCVFCDNEIDVYFNSVI